MSERKETHNGRDLHGNFRVRQVDVDDLRTDVDGADIIRDDVRLGGAVADTGAHAGELGARIGDLVDENRTNVDHLVGRDRDDSRK